jgi:hypothetical protein
MGALGIVHPLTLAAGVMLAATLKFPIAFLVLCARSGRHRNDRSSRQNKHRQPQHLITPQLCTADSDPKMNAKLTFQACRVTEHRALPASQTL